MNDLYYLASPYSLYPGGRQEAFELVCKKAAKLMEDGLCIFCPIAHSHPIEQYGMTEIHDGPFWLVQDFAILKHCSHLLVYKMPGWEESYGIKQEIAFATSYNIPITYLTYQPEQLELHFNG